MAQPPIGVTNHPFVAKAVNQSPIYYKQAQILLSGIWACFIGSLGLLVLIANLLLAEL